MKFRNPWIDPRVLQVKPADAEAYLAHHGWERLKPVIVSVTPYKRNGTETPGFVVNVPQREDEIDYPQLMIDLVAALAFAEDRWAVDVLADILQAKGESARVNGAAARQPAGSAS